MEDFPVALIAIILSVISAVAKNKKKKQTAAARKQLAKEREEKEAVPAMSQWHDAAPKPQAQARPVMGLEGVDACHDYMLPKQAPTPVLKTPAAPVMGQEGIDACHDYMLTAAPALQVEETESAMKTEEARELVRGIILSEIMARPRQRFAGRAR